MIPLIESPIPEKKTRPIMKMQPQKILQSPALPANQLQFPIQKHSEVKSFANAISIFNTKDGHQHSNINQTHTQVQLTAPFSRSPPLKIAQQSPIMDTLSPRSCLRSISPINTSITNNIQAQHPSSHNPTHSHQPFPLKLPSRLEMQKLLQQNQKKKIKYLQELNDSKYRKFKRYVNRNINDRIENGVGPGGSAFETECEIGMVEKSQSSGVLNSSERTSMMARPERESVMQDKVQTINHCKSKDGSHKKVGLGESITLSKNFSSIKKLRREDVPNMRIGNVFKHLIKVHQEKQKLDCSGPRFGIGAMRMEREKEYFVQKYYRFHGKVSPRLGSPKLNTLSQLSTDQHYSVANHSTTKEQSLESLLRPKMEAIHKMILSTHNYYPLPRLDNSMLNDSMRSDHKGGSASMRMSKRFSVINHSGNNADYPYLNPFVL